MWRVSILTSDVTTIGGSATPGESLATYLVESREVSVEYSLELSLRYLPFTVFTHRGHIFNNSQPFGDEKTYDAHGWQLVTLQHSSCAVRGSDSSRSSPIIQRKGIEVCEDQLEQGSL